MATLNASHHESGGVVLFSGELILLYCDNVNITLETKSQTSNGRLYLTTHRVVFTSQPIGQNAALKSFSAPFYAMSDLSLEQPVFGANYIKGKVRSESAPDGQPLVFKLRFSHGGAIEFGQAMDNAAKQANANARNFHFQPPPPYTATAGQYYQAPPNIYQPAYNCGFALPTQVFSEPPPAGFIYTMEAPPPYPGLNTAPENYTGGYQAFPAYGVPNGAVPMANGMAPAYSMYQNGGAMGGASAPPVVPAPAGFSFNEKPPTYDEATKKYQ